MDRDTFLQKVREAGGADAVAKRLGITKRPNVYRLHPKCSPHMAVKAAKVLRCHPADLNPEVFGGLK